MAKWLYGFLVLSLATAGIASILKFGWVPAPVMVMSPSHFDNAEAIGSALVRRFYSPIAQEKVVIFGVPPQPEWHRAIVRGFLATAAAEHVPFDTILAEEQMPALPLEGLSGLEVQTVRMNTTTQGEFVDRLEALRAAGKRVLIYSASVFTTHIISGNAIDRFEKATGRSFLTISTGPLVLRSDKEHLVEPPCLGSERDHNGTAPLGCAILQASRNTYRKRIAQDRFVAVMNSPRPNDFLLMVSEPSPLATSARAGDSRSGR